MGLVDSPKVETAARQAGGSETDVSRRTRRPPRNTIRRTIGMPCWRCRRRTNFPARAASGNGISPNVKSQGQWIHLIKTDSCESCHQLGNQYTRTIPAMFSNLDPAQAWMRRVQSGQAGTAMMGGLAQLGAQRATEQFGDWTTRIANGELPAEAPPRPQGIERNMVITQWDWADPKAYLHDEISTDKRNPTVNANGLIYGSPEESRDYLPVLDPVHNTISQLKVPYRDPDTPGQPKPLAALADLGRRGDLGQPHHGSQSHVRRARAPVVHGSHPRQRQPRVLQGGIQPSFGEAHARAELRPPVGDVRSGDQANLDDRHLLRHAPPALRRRRQQHALDQQRRWRRSGGLAQYQDVGSDARRAEIARLDGAGAGHQRQRQAGRLCGRRAERGHRAQRRKSGHFLRRQRGQRIPPRTRASTPRSMVSASARTEWSGASVLGFPGGIVRLNPGSNPPETALAEYYEVPWNDPKAPVWGFSPRGMDVDGNGVVWVALASGHLASFDRQQVQRSAQRAEGHRAAVPGRLDALSNAGTEVQERDGLRQRRLALLRLGGPVRYAGAGQEHAHHHRQFVGFADRAGEREVRDHARALSAWASSPRGWMGASTIRRPAWKGKGVWTTWGTRTPFHSETGKGTMPKVVHFQIRPDPLAD